MTTKISLAVSALVLIAGCSSDSNSPANYDVSGKGFDGPISGGTICVDVNNDGICGEGEPTATTDTFGKFTISNPNNLRGTLVLTGGIDTGTQEPFTGTFSASQNSTVLNPLTSAVQALVDSGVSASEAETTVKKALNITSTEPLSTFDPFDKSKTGTDAEKASAKEIMAAQAQLQTIIHSVSTTVAAADADTSIESTMKEAFNQVAAGLKTAVDNTVEGTDVVITEKLVSNATKAVANKVFESPSKTAAKIAVKSVADSAAVSAVAVSQNTKTAVENADVTDAVAVQLAANTGILVANTTLQNTLDATAQASSEAAKSLSNDEILAMEAAQVAQEAADAKIAAEEAKVAAAQKAALEAKKAAASATATQAEIVAAHEAEVAVAAASQEQAAAEIKAAKATQEAALLEESIAAEAAQKRAAAEAAQAAAQAALEVAAAEKAASEKAAAQAKAAADAAAAKVAADAALAAEKDAIDALRKEAADKAAAQAAEEAVAKAAADAAAQVAADAAAKSAEEAAIKAAQDEEAANNPVVTGASNQ